LPGLYPAAKPIGLAMPMSEERSVLRTSLLPNLVETAVYNRNRNNDDLALFEIGKAFVTEQSQLTEQPQEHQLLAALLTGKRSSEHWSGKAAEVDFYDLKGMFERVAASLGIQDISYRASERVGLHPGRTAEIVLADAGESRVIGVLGQLHPALQKQKDLSDTYVLEVELAPLVDRANFAIAYKSLPLFPASGRDLAFVVSADVPVGEMTASIKRTAGELLESVSVFDIYTGEKLGAGKKSVAFALQYRHSERTLTDEEVAELQAKIVAVLEQSFAAELRK